MLVTGVYATRASGDAVLLTRSFRRLRPSAPFPSECALSGGERVLAATPVRAEHEHVLVLVVAIEEDRPRDVEDTFAALSDADALSVWRATDAQPEPRALGDAARLLAAEGALTAPEAARVELLHGGVGLPERLRPGAWVGAAAVALPCRGARPPLAWRLRFRSAGGDNDWTARLDLGW